MRRIFTQLLCLFLFIFAAPLYADSHYAERPDVQAFIKKMVKKYHFNNKELTALFNKVQPRAQVLHHLNKPLEKEYWSTYQRLFVSEWRIEHGLKFWNKYSDALKRAEKMYGVPASIIVATIGVETRYGERTGDYRVIDSLSSIAFSDSRRAPYFRQELEQFLLLSREQHIDPLKMMGSYAGAIGQPQFMPSSYRAYAVNFSNSGKIDLMHNEVDVIGSIANYYSKAGWKITEPVAIPANKLGDRYTFLTKKGKLSKSLTLAEVGNYGIIPSRPVPNVDENLKVNVVTLQSRFSKEYWLAFHNFGVIKRYNPNDLYAMAVYQLSAYITDLRNRTNHG